MRNITSVAELENQIQLLEMEQEVKGELLKEQFLYTYDSFRLVNILKNSLRQTVASPNIINDIIGMAIGLGTGYLSKKIFIGTSGNVLRKLLGSIIQLGVTSVVSKHPSGIKSLGHHIIALISRKRE